MLPPETRQQHIARIRRFPADLRDLVTGLSEAQLTTRTLPGEWTVQQIVHHLPDSHTNSVTRLKLILTEAHPTLQLYDQDAWATLADVMTTPISASLAILDGLHARWADLFAALTDAQRVRTGFHAEAGTVTPDDLLVMYVTHCDEHLDQIQRVLAAFTE